MKKRAKSRWSFIVYLLSLTLLASMLLPAGAFAQKGSFAQEVTGSADDVDGFKYRDPVNITSNITGPIPTNDWWTGILTRDNVDTISPHPLVISSASQDFPAVGGGYGLAVSYHGKGYVRNTATNTYDGATNHKYQVAAYVEPNFNIWNDQMVQGSTKSKLDGFGDWHINLLTSDGAGHDMSSVISAGSPYIYYEFKNGKPKLRLWNYGADYKFYDPQGNLILQDFESTYTGDHLAFRLLHPNGLAVDENNQRLETYWGLFSAPGTVWKRHGEFLTVEIGSGADDLVSAVLPAIGDLNLYYQHAYAKITGTTATYAYDEETARITTTFRTDTTMLRTDPGFSSEPLISLFPHQYKHLDPASAAGLLQKVLPTMRGNMKLFIGNEFKTVLTNYGILPSFPDEAPIGSPSYDPNLAQQMLSNEPGKTWGAFWDSTGTKRDDTTPMVDKYNVDGYGTGKALFRNAYVMDTAAALGRDDIAQQFKTTLRAQFDNWFTYSPGQEQIAGWDGKPWGFISYFPATGGTKRYYGHLSLFRAGFGSQALNDAHFHFGYWIQAAVLMAKHDPTFLQDYGWAIDEIIRHIASPYRDDKYPYLRNFSPYKGRSFASGWYKDDNKLGNDQESTSEAMNAWQAIYQWGQITGNKTYRDLGLYLYWTEKSAIDEYWFDFDNENFHPDYPYEIAPIVRENAYEFLLHWGGSQLEEIYGIEMLPIQPGSLYLGVDHDNANKIWNDFSSWHRRLKGTDFDYWKTIMLRYLAMVDPAAAAAKFQYKPGHTYEEEYLDEDSFSATYHFIHNLNKFGRPTNTFTADIPSYGVFEKGTDAYTFMAANPSSAAGPVDVNFYDANGQLVKTIYQIPPGEVVYDDNMQQFAAKPSFSPVEGTYEGTVQVELNSATPGAAIYYTTDGSDPTQSSTPYAGPFTLSQSATVKARAYAAGITESQVATANYQITLTPKAPSNLKAEVSAADTIQLTWKDESATETQYAVYRSTGTVKPSTPYATLAANAQSASVTGLTAGSSYYFWVEAKNANGASPSITAGPVYYGPPAAPASLTGAAQGSSGGVVNWQDAASNETGYQVFVGSSATVKPAQPTALLPANSISYTLTNLAANTHYYVWVDAVNAIGAGSAGPVDIFTLLEAEPIVIDDFNSAAQWGSNLNDLQETIVRKGGSYNLEGDANLYFFYNGGTSMEGFETYLNRDISPYGTLSLTLKGGSGGEESTLKVVLNDGADHSVDLSAYGTVTTAYKAIEIPIADFGANLANAKFIRIEGRGTAKTIRIDEMGLEGAGAPPQPPTAPTALTAAAAGSSQINLAWTDQANNETGFKVYMNTANSRPLTAAATLAANAATYQATGLNANTTYYFWVEAFNAAGAGGTGPASAKTDALPQPPAAPTGLTAGTITSSTIQLAWTDNAANEDGYRVYSSLTNTKPAQPIATLGANTTSHTATGLQANTTYYFWVEAFNQGGTSAAASASAKTAVLSEPLLVDDFNSSQQWASNKNDLNLNIVRNGGIYNLEGDANLYFFFNGGTQTESFDTYIQRTLSSYSTLELVIKGGAGGEESAVKIVLNDGTTHRVNLADYGTLTTAYQTISIPLSAFGIGANQVEYLRIEGIGTAKTIRIDEIRFK